MSLLALYTATIFLGAFLLFLIQPMFAKMALPLLGGSPQVWATCMVFFQAALLAGYGYAHWTTTRLGVRRQALVHAVILLLPALSLPIAIAPDAVPPAGARPEPWLLGLLAVSVGLPFFVVSTTGPLLQKWFAEGGHRRSHDPYFLYAASNVGSMLGLLGYPLLVEPLLALAGQSLLWTWGYAALAVLILVAIAGLRRAPPAAADRAPEPLADAGGGPRGGPLTRLRAGRWILLAFVPSSLMLGLTTHVTTDIAAVPLLWVVPLAIYLLTFTLVFAQRPPIPHRAMTRSLPALATVLALLLVSNTNDPAWFVLPANFAVFFVAAMVCHGELAADRPSTEHLTAFYLLMSVGGVLGGVFNALLAPLVFDGVAEYPIAVVLACALCPVRAGAGRLRWRDGALALVPAALVLILPRVLEPAMTAAGLGAHRFDHLRTVAVIGIPLVVCYLLVSRPVRFAAALGAWFLAGDLVYEQSRGDLLLAERSFFGVHRVSYQHEYDAHLLRHGLTAHGMQKRDRRLSHIPTAYFHYTGPAGQVFIAYEDLTERVALIGLGAGTLAAYTLPGRHFTYFEIDPTVVAIAEDPALFTYLADARAEGATVDVRLGDARLTLRDEPDGEFDLLLVDAFSSASIPMHLLTREALALYLSKVQPDGLLLFHVSNNYLDIAGALGELAADAGLTALYQDNQVESDAERAEGKLASQWVVMARSPELLARLPRHPTRWRDLPARGRAVWTDDFSNIVTMLKWSARREEL